MEKVDCEEKETPTAYKEEDVTSDSREEHLDIKQSLNMSHPTPVVAEANNPETENMGKKDVLEIENLSEESFVKLKEETDHSHKVEQAELLAAVHSLDIEEKGDDVKHAEIPDISKEGLNNDSDSTVRNIEEGSYEEEEPVFDGTEEFGSKGYQSSCSRTMNNESEGQVSAWPEKAVAFTNFVRQKSSVAVCSVLRRLSRKIDDGQLDSDETKNTGKENPGDGSGNSLPMNDVQEISHMRSEKSSWNPLNIVRISSESNGEIKSEQQDVLEDVTHPIVIKGRIILYSRLGCQDCKDTRRFLHRKRLRYVEINIDVYPTRELELEKISGTSAVPKVFFNEVLIGGLHELKSMEESGELDKKIEYVITETPSLEAPLPPLSGEDDMSSSGALDELALIARKMKERIPVKDRFHKIRRFTNCFLGSEAVDFLSEDQYLEREEAVEFGRKLANKLFFQHIAAENMFEDGNHLYRFLDDDPVISQCQNIPRGISESKPKPITEISSRLRFLSYAILESYASEDGKHLDYRSIHGSEEFARYLRIVEELQRVELYEMAREEKLSFFINLYNMMAIHAILVWGHPSGALERRKLLGAFKYVIGGSTYSLSSIYNGILRGNQRPPYNLIKPFGMKDKRLQVALPYPEPLVHFALVSGTRSGPAIRCYSPGNIDKELIESARNFLRTGGLYVDLIANVAYASKILKWYSVDFGKNEVEVLKHAANYLDMAESQATLDVLSNTQLKVIYQPFDWGLNH